MNRRIGGIIGAIVLALVGAVLVIAYANGADRRAESGTKVVSVYTVRTDEIPAGTPTADLGDRVARTDLPKKAVAEGAITDLKQVKGLVTGALLVAGSVVAVRTPPFARGSEFAAAPAKGSVTGSPIEISPGWKVGGACGAAGCS